MYKLEQARQDTQTHTNQEIWNGKISCYIGYASNLMSLNNLRDTVEVYAFTFVREGEVVLLANDKPITLHRNDLYINLPGFKIRAKSSSDDYKCIVLLIDVKFSLDSPVTRDMVRSAFFPLLELKEPKMTLSEEEGQRLSEILLMIRQHIMSESFYKDYKERILKMLYSVFVLELMNMQEQKKRKINLSEHTEELYISFIRMLPENFKEHHDICFYANQLNVTPTYLSRLVKQVTDHTVVDFVNQMLMSEASWLLTTTNMPIAQIAEELHFSDQASFSKFFSRMKGVTPKDYRKKA